MQFADRYSPQEIKSSFGDERFSLERALGYEGKPSQPTDASIKTKKKAIQTTVTAKDDDVDEGEDEAEEDEGEEEEKERTDNTAEAEDEEAEPTKEENAWDFSDDSATAAAKFLFPGQFELRFENSQGVCNLQVNRKQLDKLYYQFDKVMEKDDAYKATNLPQ